jgi:hypothetical protein
MRPKKLGSTALRGLEGSKRSSRLIGRFRRNSSGAFGSKADEDPHRYLKNDGVVEGVWMFCRHGDRTPSRPLSPSHRRKEEAAYWMTRLPSPDSATAFEAYSRCFPPDIHQNTNHGQFLDVGRNPFGFLTQMGLSQLKENGHRFFHRYNHYGHHSPNLSEWRWENPEDFLSVWDVKVFSTNYLRTIMSVQSFLDGMLGANCYTPSPQRTLNPDIFEEARVPNHAWRGKSFGKDELVKVRVRELSRDPLNAFDRNPDLMADLVDEVISSEDFMLRDGAAAPLAARLANILPGLVKPRKSDFSSRAPSGINWVEAADHFVCRSSHGMDLARFSDYEHDVSVEQMLCSLSHQTLMHLSWRFRKWYQNKRLLAAIAAPPLREITESLKVATSLDTEEKRPFTIYSCHDITILGLLYGIGADFLADDTSADWRFWPEYGSSLVFELVRLHKEGPVDSHSHVVRVLLNGKPIRSVEFDAASKRKMPSGRGPEQMMWVQDFEKMVTHLENDGGHDYAMLLGGSAK